MEGGKDATAKDLESFQAKQTMYFLDELITNATLSHETIDKMDALYKLSSSPNVEIQFRYLMLCLSNKYSINFCYVTHDIIRYTSVVPKVGQFLSTYGRGLYVKPLYKTLISVDYDAAQKIYNDNKPFYHAIIRTSVEGFLKAHKK